MQKGQETKEVSQADDNARGAIQRKTRNIPISGNLKLRYTKRVAVLLNQLIGLIKVYNSFPMRDLDYDHQLAQLHAIKEKAWETDREISQWRGFLNKRGTWRSLGGPFRYRYYTLSGSLRKLAGDYLKTGGYKEIVLKEIDKVEKQKERGLEINA